MLSDWKVFLGQCCVSGSRYSREMGRIGVALAGVVLLLQVGLGTAHAQDPNAAVTTFKNPAATEAEILTAVAALEGYVNNAQNDIGARQGYGQILGIAYTAIQKESIMGQLDHIITSLSAQAPNLNWANPQHINQLRQQGRLNYRNYVGATPFPGLDNLFFAKMAEYEAEAIQRHIAKTTGQPVPPPTPPAPPAGSTAPPAKSPGAPPAAPNPPGAPSSPAAPAVTTFQAGDGEAKAKQFLASKNLIFVEPRSGSDKEAIWILKGETELKPRMKEIGKANGKFVKIRREVKKIEEAMPAYDRFEADTKKKIAELSKKIGEAYPWPADGEKAERAKLQKEIEKKVGPIKKALADANKRSEAAYDVVDKLLTETSEQLENLVLAYGELAEDEAVLEAMAEAGGLIGPTPQLDKYHRKLPKIRASFERMASQ